MFSESYEIVGNNANISRTKHISHMERLNFTKFNILASILSLNMTTKNFADRSTGSGTFHISQIGKLGFGIHGTSDSHQI